MSDNNQSMRKYTPLSTLCKKDYVKEYIIVGLGILALIMLVLPTFSSDLEDYDKWFDLGTSILLLGMIGIALWTIFSNGNSKMV